MSQQLTTLTKTFITSGTTVTANRVVKFTGTAVTLWDTVTAYPIGIAQYTADPSTTVEVVLLGTCKAVSETATTVGDVLTIATNGSITPKLSTAYTHTSGIKTIGLALETTPATGATIEIFFNRESGVQA